MNCDICKKEIFIRKDIEHDTAVDDIELKRYICWSCSEDILITEDELN